MSDQAISQSAEQPARVAEEQAARKPMKYYIDFENVHGPGLKGVDALNEDDHVLVFYSQAAETFHIEHAIDLLNSKAKIEFIEIDGGTRNSLDFQLVAALFGTISDEYGYAIVSGDGGFDAAIKMGQRLDLPEIVRVVNILGDTELPTKPRSRRTRSSKSAAKEQLEASEQGAAEQSEQDRADAEATEQPKPARRSRRRGGARRTTAAKADQPAGGQDEAVAVGQAEEHVGDSARGQATERKDEAIGFPVVDGAQVELSEAKSENEAKSVPQSDSGKLAKQEKRSRRKAKGGSNGDVATSASDDADNGGDGNGTGDGNQKSAAAGNGDSTDNGIGDDAGDGRDDNGAGNGNQKGTAIDNGDVADNGASDDNGTGGDSQKSADEGGNGGGNVDGQKGNGNGSSNGKEAGSGNDVSSNGNGGSRRRGSRGSGKSGKREDVAALLAKHGVEVDQHQLSTVMQALNGAKRRQDFYRKIIQLEKQEKGLALYREVRDYYEPMLEIVKA